MVEYINLCLALFEIFCIVEGQTFTISTKFKNGDLLCEWTNTTAYKDYIKISTDTNFALKWELIASDRHIVKDVIKYQFVNIEVREHKSSDLQQYVDHKKIYKVSLVDANIGESKFISWIAGSFPQSGVYHIYKDAENIIIVKNEHLPNSKYYYHSRPYNSTNITFEVTNITSIDAGFYAGGPSKVDAGSDGGVVLVVKKKPTKPVIKGNLNVSINTQVNLTCSSKSTSAPDYYSRIVAWNYSWYVNTTILEGEDNKEYRFTVTKDVKYNNYSCQSQEHFKFIQGEPSDRSYPVRINPMYGPGGVQIIPPPPFNVHNRVTLPEGEKFGPYSCSADCNPPCIIQWKQKKIGVDFQNIEFAGKNLSEQRVDKDTESFQCVAIWNSTYPVQKSKTINMDILYLSKPKIILNGISQNRSDIRKGENLPISCHVDGNPNPTIILSKVSNGQVFDTEDSNCLDYTITKVQCSDTGTYRCTGNSTQFERKIKDFTVNVICDPQLDTSVPFKTNYGSMSGKNVKVFVTVPVLANPLPSSFHSRISWQGPGYLNITNTVSKSDNVIYKHWINSTIPIPDQRCFGNYTVTYNGTVIVNIAINAEDLPKPPLNFTWNSNASGYVSLTWVSNFNGGPEQIFILSKKKGSSWTFVQNLTDPGEMNMGYYDLGPLVPGQEYLYQLESCNRINCSLSPVEVQFIVQARSSPSSLLMDTTMMIVIGASAAVFVLVVILTVAMKLYCKRKKSPPKKSNSDERLSGLQDNTPVDVVVYAAVDKSVLMKNSQQVDKAEGDAIKDKNDDNEAMYSEVIKKPNIHNKTDSKKEEKKKNGEKELQGKKEEAEASNRNDDSRTTNQDGLVYIDVEFAKKPQSSDTKGKPIIHGDEERTEYTFVDFSKKAPPKQEQQDNTT
ncbi:uncharacterized protein LOC133179720 [Saccostrea echinata]|uniref:uncharacterized protein LOC133179720 n=1 Tax=Saccostrea echinata TaxID=191078 RepID=UPI002A835A03|nr:uncharacterized protein LOC133179720 [Saccostrea echinata]